MPEGLPPWIVSGASIIFLCLLLWKRLAEVKGPLGTLARLWERRQIRAIENDLALGVSFQELVDQRVDSRTKGIQETLERLEGQVKELQEARAADQVRIEREATARRAAEESRDQWSAYASKLTMILHRVRQILAEHGIPMEHVPSFSEFHRTRDPTE